MILSGRKKFELRLNDFKVKPGDILVLEEWDPQKKAYTGRKIKKKVTYVLRFKLNDLFWPEKDIKTKGLQIISLE
ncbi:MAG: hypothetical protein KatS3mg091_234 [Patescibacteria group bacterium]|nr:MAG: hypothetical protein KatS3mg091_234 [Patescibacteria group bacterium]